MQVEDGAQPAFNDGNWTTIATFKADGTCKEEHDVIVALHEGTFPPLRIHIRTVTGTARVLPVQAKQAGMP